MNKTLLISASLSSKSINFELLKCIQPYIPSEFENELLSIRDYELPLYNVDIEKEPGIAENAHKFIDVLNNSGKLIFSIAEHNGSFTSGFKNLLDWLSRVNKNYKFLSGKEIMLVGTSPSPLGSIDAIHQAKFVIEKLGGKVVHQLPVPSFYSNFSTTGQGWILNNETLKEKLISTISSFLSPKEELVVENELVVAR